MSDTTSIGLLTIPEIVEHLKTRCDCLAVAYREIESPTARYDWGNRRIGSGFEAMAQAELLYENIKDSILYPYDEEDDDWHQGSPV